MDILMQENSLPLKNGDFQLVSGVDEIKQQIIIALNTFYGDWALDYTVGIDYVYGLRHEEFLEYDIKKQICGVVGVLAVNNFAIEYDKTNLGINVTASIKTVYGKVDIQTTINRG